MNADILLGKTVASVGRSASRHDISHVRQTQVAYLHGQRDLVILPFEVQRLNGHLDAELLEHEVEPLRVVVTDLLSVLLAAHLPLIVELIDGTEFVSDGRNVQLTEHPVVHVAANPLAEDVLRVAIILAVFRELSLTDDLLENEERLGALGLDVVGFLAVIRVDPHVAV